MIEVLEYIDSRGRIPYRDWVAKLGAATRARIIASVLRMERGISRPRSASGPESLRLRLNFGPGYRVYFGMDGEQLVILLGGGSKRRQPADIAVAQALWVEYKRRKLEA